MILLDFDNDNEAKKYVESDESGNDIDKPYSCNKDQVFDYIQVNSLYQSKDVVLKCSSRFTMKLNRKNLK